MQWFSDIDKIAHKIYLEDKHRNKIHGEPLVVLDITIFVRFKDTYQKYYNIAYRNEKLNKITDGIR